jgi:hypothetical protein
MKLLSLLLLVASLAFAALAGDIVARVTEPGAPARNITVTTNTTTLPGPYWDAPDGGGHYEMTFQFTNSMVIVTHHTWSASKGIGSEIINRTRIQTNRIPFTFTVAQSTVSVMRVEQTLPRKDLEEKSK